MTATNPNPEPTLRQSRRTLDLGDQSTFEMDELIAARNEREGALTITEALIDEGTNSFANEHYSQLALLKAFGRLLEAATDRATASVLDKMALKNGEIYAPKASCRSR